MTRPVEIRRAGSEDASTVARLLHDFNTEFEDETPGVEALTEFTRPLIEGGEIVVLLAGDADGLSLWRLRPSPWTGRPEAYLQELYVVPARRGGGIGRALLEATMAAAREAGATGIDLNTGETDTEARALYESAGFTNLEGPGGRRMLFYEREL
ncbi:MAG TPA: GNAT family N-acetyltransferase [Solirubrobacterales bacterium]|jgi:ribosomal protein S18 acetylase RimI-like enzyme